MQISIQNSLSKYVLLVITIGAAGEGGWVYYMPHIHLANISYWITDNYKQSW